MSAHEGWVGPGGPGERPVHLQPMAVQPPPGRGAGVGRRFPPASVLVPVAGAVVALVAVVAATVTLLQAGGGPASPAVGVSGLPVTAPGTAEEPVPLGTPARVGNYELAVTAVILDGDALVASGNQFNEPAEGRYVVVEATARYVGADEGSPFWDLSYVFNGTDGRQYADTGCSAVLPEDAIHAPTLNPGGAASFQVCMDVPPTAIEGGGLFIEPLSAFDRDERVYFSTS